LTLSTLPAEDLRKRLRSSGLRLRLGPIVASIRSPFRAIADSVAQHYAAHEVVDVNDFADFDVSVDAPFGLRRYVKSQAVFAVEGRIPFRPLPAAQAFPLLEWGLNWCISANCHQFLMIHAAVVERKGHALVLPAPPGSGKSTLCAGLVAHGWRLLSDELALIDRESGRLIPIPRPISLKNDSIATIARFWHDAVIGAPVHDTIKGTVAHVTPPPASVRSSDEPAEPAWIVLPRFRGGASQALTELSRAAAFMRLVESAFNYSILGRDAFEMLGNVVAHCACFEFVYGGDLSAAVRCFDDIATNG
jgi:HprK-related kinase A